jgi:hypothetical protein
MTRRLQGAIIACLVIAAGVVIVSNVGGVWDWVFIGVVLFTLVGASTAVYGRQYTTKKRTFVRTSKPPR